MKTSTFEKRIPMLPRACVLAALPILAVMYFTGCGFIGGFNDENTPEGDRCNPYQSHNPCKAGAVCAGAPPASPDPFQPFVLIPFCPEDYCCSVDDNLNITSGDPNCQPGCNGGAASICAADQDPGACLFADGGSLAASEALDNMGSSSSSSAMTTTSTPDAGDAGDGAVE